MVFRFALLIPSRLRWLQGVGEVRNAADAVRLAEDMNPDLISLDLRLGEGLRYRGLPGDKGSE
jgi:hypothetical protein